MEKHGALSGIVTQNVDRLHHAAGSQNVVELHGRGDQVACLSCHHILPRRQFTEHMEALNQSWMDQHDVQQFNAAAPGGGSNEDIRADGDAHLDLGKDFEEFAVPPCPSCADGVLMPDLVFFGGSIANTVKDAAAKIVDDNQALMVFGSSCMVYSSYRLVRAAHLANKPIMMVNIGDTRVDPFITPGLKFETTTDEATAVLLEALGIPSKDALVRT